MNKGDNMLVIGYWETKPELIDDVLALYKDVDDKREKGLLNHPKSISDNYMYSGKNSGFRLFEVTDPIQIENVKYYYYGLIEWTFKPIIEANKSVKAYMDSKK